MVKSVWLKSPDYVMPKQAPGLTKVLQFKAGNKSNAGHFISLLNPQDKKEDLYNNDMEFSICCFFEKTMSS